MDGKRLIKHVLIYPVVKAGALFGVSYAVVGNNGLSAFVRSLIIACVSGALGIIGIAVGAIINAKVNKQMLEMSEDNRELLREIKELQNQQGKKVDKIADNTANGTDTGSVADQLPG